MGLKKLMACQPKIKCPHFDDLVQVLKQHDSEITQITPPGDRYILYMPIFGVDIPGYINKQYEPVGGEITKQG